MAESANSMATTDGVGNSGNILLLGGVGRIGTISVLGGVGSSGGRREAAAIAMDACKSAV
jgi:hypothetical protein